MSVLLQAYSDPPFISVAIITFIRSDFKETEENSKKIVEDIKIITE